MARYDKEHKQATRRRIVEAAGRRFKQDGIDGAGIATLMADAGLTNGAFYAHFASKDDLVAEVVAHELDVQSGNVGALPPGRAGLEAYVRQYLSPEHRESVADGCPAAALLDELGRCALPTRRTFSEGTDRLLDEIAARLAPDSPREGRGLALSLYALMIGILQISRAEPDSERAREILGHGRERALELVRS